MSVERRAKAHIVEKIQMMHEKHVLEYCLRMIQGWKDGALHDHDARRLAKLMDVKLEPPAFLDKLLEILDSVVIKD